MLQKPAQLPMKVLLQPLVLLQPAQLPIKVLLQPVLLARPAQLPMKVLLLPLVKAAPAFVPTRKLLIPEALREDGFVMHEENIFVEELPIYNGAVKLPYAFAIPIDSYTSSVIYGYRRLFNETISIHREESPRNRWAISGNVSFCFIL